jgi:uncharacterized protein (DUF3820 family)
MPIGKFRGCLIRDLPEYAAGYAERLLAQPWFRQRYPDEALALGRAVKLWSDPEQRQLILNERRHAFAKREAERLARWASQEQEWLERHIVRYEPRGIWPFGKYKGQPLANVARDEYYCRWFKGTVYARMNPELAADLKAVTETVATGKTAMVSIELHDGGCVIYRPTVWCHHD